MSSPASPPLMPEGFSLKQLAELYEQAFFTITLFEDAELLKIREEVVAEAVLLVKPDRLQLRAYYAIDDDTEPSLPLQLVNRINARSAVVRAYQDEESDLVLSHTILLKGGVTKKAILEATRHFLAEVPEVIHQCDVDNIIS